MIDRPHLLRLARTRGPAVVLDLGVNIALPFAIYSYAAPMVGDVKALLASSLPPIAWSLVEFIRKRRVDIISMLVLAGIVLSLLAFFGGGGPRMLQLREKLVTGVIGLVFLISAAIRRPLIYELVLAGMKRKGSDEHSRLAGLRDDPLLRRSMTVMTVVWGFGLIVDVAIGSALIFLLTIKEYLVIGPIEGNVIMGMLALWTFWYSRRSRAKNQAIRAAEAAKSSKDET